MNRAGAPWETWMALGLGRMRLSPPAFWAMSLKEWRAALGPSLVPEPVGRAELQRMMEEFPDEPG
jgi:uncharacterized phage protein (TIGR02216 family)